MALGLPVAHLKSELSELSELQLVPLLLRGGCLRGKGIILAAATCQVHPADFGGALRAALALAPLSR